MLKQFEWPKHFIVPYFSKREGLLWYSRVCYSPLDEEAARKCLRTFTEKVHDALEELHKFGFAHSDVRLPNICFDQEENAVLIDLQLAETSDIEFRNSVKSLQTESCLYRRPKGLEEDVTAGMFDYIQLAWLLVWVLENQGRDIDYHQQDEDELPLAMKSDKFITQLFKGKYDQNLLEESQNVIDRAGVLFSSLLDQGEPGQAAVV